MLWHQLYRLVVRSQVVLFAVSMVFVWSSVSYQVIVLLAGWGFSNYYEAARIDGAEECSSSCITLPLLSPSIFCHGHLHQCVDFDIIIWSSQYSSGTAASRSLATFFFEEAFIKFQKGYGAAIAVALFVVIMVVTLAQMWFQKKWVHYDE